MTSGSYAAESVCAATTAAKEDARPVQKVEIGKGGHNGAAWCQPSSALNPLQPLCEKQRVLHGHHAKPCRAAGRAVRMVMIDTSPRIGSSWRMISMVLRAAGMHQCMRQFGQWKSKKRDGKAQRLCFGTISGPISFRRAFRASHRPKAVSVGILAFKALQPLCLTDIHAAILGLSL